MKKKLLVLMVSIPLLCWKCSIIKNNQTRDTNSSKEEQAYSADTISIELGTKRAIQKVQKELSKDTLFKTYEEKDDSLQNPVNVKIQMGKIFNDGQKYLLLHVTSTPYLYINLYKVCNNKLDLQFHSDYAAMTFGGDTIFDVNGDEHKDFVTFFEPSSGCCMADIYNVILNLPENAKFSEIYEFINPTFSAKEKIIRGVEYGHSGEVPLYKYKWNGLSIDTLEYIYPDKSKRGQFIRTKREVTNPTKENGEVLNAVPEEYLETEGYGWFSEYLK